jgi:digeranylgeranylglycerophospholipid reductase
LNDKIANIGLGIPGGQKLDLSKLLANYIKNVTNDNYEIVSTFRSCVPTTKPIKRLIKDNVIITGDAARLVHPLSGGGINNAIFSGSIAGIIAAKYVNKELKSLELYKELLQRKIKTITREYQIKCNMMKSNDSFLTKYRMGVASIYFINKYFSRIFERLIPKLTEKDKKILKSLGESYKLL